MYAVMSRQSEELLQEKLQRRQEEEQEEEETKTLMYLVTYFVLTNYLNPSPCGWHPLISVAEGLL